MTKRGRARDERDGLGCEKQRDLGTGGKEQRSGEVGRPVTLVS